MGGGTEDREVATAYGRFVTRGVIGRGAGGLVVRAHDPELDREVALKVLDDGPHGERLLREAQILAKLAHPNLLAIFETGPRFIAMELVESTLERWLAERARPAREVIAMFLACARGLAVAHSLELEQRAFSPAHVLVGDDGRPRVAWSTDLRSFCAALEHALAGEAVPKRIRIAVRREWSHWGPLIDELARRERRWWPSLAGLGAAAVLAVVAVRTLGDEADPCPDPASRLAAIWDGAMRERVSVAFIAANPAIGADTARRIVPELDRYATEWRSAVRAACRATHVEGSQSPEVLDQRMSCLERRRDALAALTHALATTDRDRVATSLEAVGGLAALAPCANRELMQAEALPADAARRGRIAEVEAAIRASSASRYDGKPSERQARATAALEAARELDYPPTLLRALEEHYSAASDNFEKAAAEASLRELARRAAEAKHDELAAKAWSGVIGLLAGRNQPAEAKALEPAAEAAVTRAGRTPALRYTFAHAQGVARNGAQDYAGAIEAFRTAVEVAPTELLRADAKRDLAKAIANQRGSKDALPLAEDSLAATEAAYGPNHPRTAAVLHLLADLHDGNGDLAASFEAETRALAIREAALGPDHREVAFSLHMLGNIAHRRGDSETAKLHYQRAIDIRVPKGDIADASLTRAMLATATAKIDGIEKARPIFVQALAEIAEHFGKDNMAYLENEANFASRLAGEGKCEEAAPLFAHAATGIEKVLPRDLPLLVVMNADCAFKVDPADAIARLERARAACAEHGCSIPIPEAVAWYLGKALYETRKDRARGLALVEEARTLAVKHEYVDLADEIARWRKVQRLPAR